MGILYLLPRIASVILFLLLWQNDVLERPGLAGVCCAAGLVLQFVGEQFGIVWLAGLVINSGVAVYLSVRLKLS